MEYVNFIDKTVPQVTEVVERFPRLCVVSKPWGRVPTLGNYLFE